MIDHIHDDDGTVEGCPGCFRDPTDKDRLLDLLKRFGITPADSVDCGYATDEAVVLRADHGNVEGYSDFIAVFTFDNEGNFLKAGIWE